MQLTSKQNGQFDLMTASVVGKRMTSLIAAISSPFMVSRGRPASSNPGLSGGTLCGAMLSRVRLGLGRRFAVDAFCHGPNSLKGALGVLFLVALTESF